MELVAWRLENEADPRIGDEVEPDLVRRARCSAGDRAGKLVGPRPAAARRRLTPNAAATRAGLSPDCTAATPRLRSSVSVV